MRSKAIQMDFKIVQGENSNFNGEKAYDRGYFLGYLLLNSKPFKFFMWC